MKISPEVLQEILSSHRRWLKGKGGNRAILQGAILQGADLRGAYLQDADLQDADLQGAILQGAILQGAILQDADLQGAYLQGAILQDANGRDVTVTKAPIQISNLRWFVTIWDEHMQIGCEFHSHKQWAEYDDSRISSMDSNALKFWGEWKDVLLALCNKHRGKNHV